MALGRVGYTSSIGLQVVHTCYRFNRAGTSCGSRSPLNPTVPPDRGFENMRASSPGGKERPPPPELRRALLYRGYDIMGRRGSKTIKKGVRVAQSRPRCARARILCVHVGTGASCGIEIVKKHTESNVSCAHPPQNQRNSMIFNET